MSIALLDKRDQAEAAPLWYRLRPGAEVLRVAPDRVAVMFPNYSVSFYGVENSRVCQTILELARTGIEENECIHDVVKSTGVSAERVEHLLQELASTDCLVRGTEPLPVNGPLQEFLQYSEREPNLLLRRLETTVCPLILPSAVTERLGGFLTQAELHATIFKVNVGDPVQGAAGRFMDIVESTNGPIGCWGFGFRSPMALEINAEAIRRARPVLFGTTQGAIARIGPYVIPDNTGCLLCAASRLLSNAGSEEVAIAASYAARYRTTVNPQWPVHPLFEAAAFLHFILELSTIVCGRSGLTTGGFVEMDVSGLIRERRRVLRVPRCPACHRQSPSRLPWDVRFEASGSAT